MKILVTCFSQTGNTEKIAHAILDELAQSHETDYTAVDEIDAEHLNAYDLVFLGSPIHAGGLAAPVKELLKALPDNPGYKLAAFMTHASSALNKQGYESGVQQFHDISKEKRIDCLGCYDCQGRLTHELHDMVQKAQNVPDDEWAEKMAECDKHPSKEDEDKARAFARDMASLIDSK